MEKGFGIKVQNYSTVPPVAVVGSRVHLHRVKERVDCFPIVKRIQR